MFGMSDYMKFAGAMRRELAILSPPEAAKSLLGRTLFTPGGRVRIVECEAYAGDEDPASHAFRGRTKRNEVMFGPPGFAYIYLNYGIHWLLNVTARPEGEPAAILIRAVRHLDQDEPASALAGPGRLTYRLGIGQEFNGADLLDEDSPLHLALGERVSEILVAPRVGLTKGKGHETPWRFIAASDVAYASRPHRGILVMRGVGTKDNQASNRLGVQVRP